MKYLYKNKTSHKNNTRSSNSNFEISFGVDRVFFMKVLSAFLFIVVIGRLFYMQIIEHKKYQQIADSYQEKTMPIKAGRGEIYVFDNNKNNNIKDAVKDGTLNLNELYKIASNIFKYNVIAVPKNLFNNEDKMAEEMYSIVGSSIATKDLIKEKLKTINNFDTFSEKLFELSYPDLYKYKGYGADFEKLNSDKVVLEREIKTLKNGLVTNPTTKKLKTKNKTIEDKLKPKQESLYIINKKLSGISEEDIKNINSYKNQREVLFTRLNQKDEYYRIAKKMASEQEYINLIAYLENLYYDNFKQYIQGNNQTKVAQLKNFYKNFIYFEKNETRYYPDGNYFGQITGFLVNQDTKTVGQYGIEDYYNDVLKGVNGEVTGKYDPSKNIIATSTRTIKEAKKGDDLVLTIDRTIQYTICKELEDSVKKYEAKSGSILVMNPKTGAIMAMCNTPSFNSNEYNKVKDVKTYSNPIISDQVEFGSVMKVMTMAAGIDSGAVTPYSTYMDTGCATIGDWVKPICNSDSRTKGAHGETDMVTILDKSLNLGAWYVANKTGADNFKKYMDDFGFGKKTNIDFVSEASGDMRNLEKIKFKKGGDVYFATASFGQGVTITQLQYLAAFSSVVNGGNLMKPYIVDSFIDGEGNIHQVAPQVTKKVLKDNTSTVMKGMLASVIEKGYDRLAQVKGYYVGGKTGTAQLVEENGVYSKDNTMQSFVGFGPVDDPKFAVMIKLEAPKTEFASYSCTPIFFDIAKFLFDYYQIPPDKKD